MKKMQQNESDLKDTRWKWEKKTKQTSWKTKWQKWHKRCSKMNTNFVEDEMKRWDDAAKQNIID